MYVCVSRRVFDYVYTNTWLRMHVHGCMYAYKQNVILYYDNKIQWDRM